MSRGGIVPKVGQQRHPPGTIGVCGNDTGRFTAFTMSLAGVQSPSGTELALAVGSDIVNGRNILVDERMSGDWIWFMDDDHAFHGQMLMQLLDWNVDVVAPLCLMRQSPFQPVAQPLDLKTVATHGLVQVEKTGTAGMLVRKKVFDRIQARWPGPVFDKSRERSEDYMFCDRLAELGIPIHVDVGQLLGHLATVVVWPGRTAEDVGCVTFQIADQFTVSVEVQE